MFEGTFTALVTPFRNGEVDRDALKKIIEIQIASGITGVVPVGTTGESPTLTHEEHTEVIRITVETVAGRCKVIAGTGSNSTSEAISLTKEAEKLGADAALLVAPYYNKPSQEGLYRHYRDIAASTGLPIVLYSIPGRCGIEIAVPTVARLAADCPNIKAIKEAGGTVERVSQLRVALPEEFEILSGDDSMTVPFMSVGAVGVISVASNLLPLDVGKMVAASLDGDARLARQEHLRLYHLFKALLAVGPNPVPIKFAMESAGICSGEVRQPLCPLEPENADTLAAVLREGGFTS